MAFQRIKQRITRGPSDTPFVRRISDRAVFISRSAGIPPGTRVDVLRDGARWRIEPGTEFKASSALQLGCADVANVLPIGERVYGEVVDGGFEFTAPGGGDA